MPIILKMLYTKYDLNRTQDKSYLHDTGCHGNLVTIAMRYVADAYHTKTASYQI